MSKTFLIRFTYFLVFAICFVLATIFVYKYLNKPISNEQFIINKIDERLEEVDNHQNNDSFVSTYSNDLSDLIDLNELSENDSNNQYDSYNEQNGYFDIQNDENNRKKKDDEVVLPRLSPEEYFSLGELYQHGKFGREKNPNKAIFNIKKAIHLSDESDHELLGKCHLTLGQIFESISNRESAHDMLNHYLQALSYGYEECILLIGKLYTNGLHPYYLPDKMVAAKIYSNFSNFSETIKPWCQLNLQDIYKVSYQDLDVLRQNNINYESLPSDITDQMVYAANKIRTVIPYKSVVDKRLLIKYDDEFPNTRKLKPAKNTPKKVSILTRLPKQVVHNDTQNVHDHSLQNIGNIIIDKLEKNKSTDSSSNDFNNNLSELLNRLDQKKYPHVKRVCESLNNLTHSRFDKSEQDVFNLIWNKVKNKNDSKELFLDNINSAVEHGYVVCSTGKIMRMLSTLDIVDDNVPNLKPDWVIKQEIMQTIGNTINKLTKQEKNQYESEHNDNIKNIIKNRVRNKCLKEYKNVLEENIVDLYLKDYFEYI